MAEQEYFKKALSNFTYDMASGGAIRHLADVGYTVKQIMENLSYPTPRERVQKTVWEHLLNTGVILLEEPGTNVQHGTITYIKEYNKYGKASFRRVTTQQEKKKEMLFKEYTFQEHPNKKLAEFLLQKCAENGEKESYVSCRFGLYRKNPDQLNYMLDLLTNDQRDYILGLPWDKKLCYHRLDQRMQEIALKLYSDGNYHECLYFTKISEKVYL